MPVLHGAPGLESPWVVVSLALIVLLTAQWSVSVAARHLAVTGVVVGPQHSTIRGRYHPAGNSATAGQVVLLI